jgi:hypothetical protein
MTLRFGIRFRTNREFQIGEPTHVGSHHASSGMLHILRYAASVLARVVVDIGTPVAAVHSETGAARQFGLPFAQDVVLVSGERGEQIADDAA